MNPYKLRKNGKKHIRSGNPGSDVLRFLKKGRSNLLLQAFLNSHSHVNGQADPMSEAFLQMAGVFSQLELFMIRARARSGMENAKTKGK